MYGLIGKIKAVPGKRGDLIKLLVDDDLKMNGCVSYVVAEDSADPDAIWVTEVWDSQASHKASLSLPSVQKAISLARPIIAGFVSQHETKPIGGPGLGSVAAPFKPASYSTVSPYLIVNGAGETIEFLKRVFGAVELRRFSDESGKLMHAEVRIEDTVIMLADPAPPEWPAIPSYVHIYVQDVDAAYRKALDAGAVSVQEPVKKQDEDKRGGVKDSGGTTWWIATKVV